MGYVMRLRTNGQAVNSRAGCRAVQVTGCEQPKRPVTLYVDFNGSRLQVNIIVMIYHNKHISLLLLQAFVSRLVLRELTQQLPPSVQRHVICSSATSQSRTFASKHGRRERHGVRNYK